MKITTLIENETVNHELKTAHGLSLHIEWKNRKILFDVGPNGNFIKNAERLGVDLKEVDTVIISHGHFDHGKGLRQFMKINDKATIYVSRNAFGKQYKKLGMVYIPIGIKKPKDVARLEYVDDKFTIVPGLKIYSGVEFVEQIIGDNSLLTTRDGQYVEDHFDHEIYLVIEEGEKCVLFSGCSHKGIENIIDHIEQIEGKKCSHVIAGFHLSHYDSYDSMQTTYLERLGNKLVHQRDTKYFSCHCTGDEAFFELKQHMDKQLNRIKTGSIIEI